MATAADYLRTAYENACQRLSELDTVAVTSRARMTYTEGGRTFGWNEYREHLLQQIKELGGTKDQPGLIQNASDPVEVWA